MFGRKYIKKFKQMAMLNTSARNNTWLSRLLEVLGCGKYFCSQVNYQWRMMFGNHAANAGTYMGTAVFYAFLHFFDSRISCK